MVNTSDLIKSDCIIKWNQCIQLLTFWNSRVILGSPLATDESPSQVKYTNCSYQLVSGSMAHKPQKQPVLRHCKMSSALCHSFLSLEHCVILYPYTHARVLGSLFFTGISPLSRVLNCGCTLDHLGALKSPMAGWHAQIYLIWRMAWCHIFLKLSR